MTLGERLQALRKSRGLSQEQLAEQVGVSRQAVSKWELDESSPDLDKVLLLSEFFGVTTDYLLKGGDGKPAPEDKRKTIGQVMYVVSAGLMGIGLLIAFASWYDRQIDSVIWGGMTMQVAGVVWYFIGKLLSGQEPPFILKMLNWALGLFLPCSMVATYIHYRHFAPYPLSLLQGAVFAILYGMALFVVYCLLKRK